MLAVLQPATPVQGARVSGRVLDAPVDGKPVRRAVVTVLGNALPAGRSAITDEEGRFAFADLPAGAYTVHAARPAFLKNAYGASRPGRPGTPVALAAGEQATDLIVLLPHGSAIEGVLRDTAGDPAPGMRVEAIRILRQTQGERAERVGVAFTDDRGIYRVYGLPAGEYVLAVTPAVVVGGLGEVGAPSEADVDALLQTARRRAASSATPPSAPPVPPARTETPATPSMQRGYSMPATFYPGTVSPGEAGRLALGANDDLTGMDFAMKLSNAATVTGTIVAASAQSVPQVMIQIRGWGPELPVFGGAVSGGPSVTTNRTEGTFRIANVAPGRYRIVARSLNAPGNPTTSISAGGAVPPPGADGGPVLWAEADIHVTGDDLAGVTLTLQPAPRLSGRVVFDASTAKPPSPTSVRLQLEPTGVPGEPSNGLTAPITTAVRADGNFEFSAVIPGTYRMTALTPAGVWARSADFEARDLLDELLTVRAGNLSGVVVRLNDKPSAIAGTLTTPAGRPASGYFVVAFPDERARRRWPSRAVVVTRPATNGAFALEGVPPGRYKVAVLTDLDPADLGDAAFLDTLAAAGVTVAVGEGERKIQDFRIGG